MPFRLYFWPTVMTIPALIVLMLLGTWQLQRLEWKQDLIDKLQSRAVAEAVELPAGALEIEDWEFQRVRLTGTFDHGNELFWVQRSRTGEAGFHVVTPFTRADGQGTVLVARGWVPFDRRGQEFRQDNVPQDEQTILGILRFDRGRAPFLPENEPGNNTWFWLDPVAAAQTVGVPGLPTHFVMAETQGAGPLPEARQWTLDVRNNHLEYALTWYGLAAALLTIFVIFHLRQGKPD
jgi:surfeit locus 1 family protein